MESTEKWKWTLVLEFFWKQGAGWRRNRLNISFINKDTHCANTKCKHHQTRSKGQSGLRGFFLCHSVCSLGHMTGSLLCVCVRVRETQKGNANRDKRLHCLGLLNHRLHISGWTQADPLGQKPSRGVWKWSGVSWKTPYSSGEWLCWLEPEPIEELSWPHTFSQPGAPALITRLGHANTWYHHNAVLCYCQTGYSYCVCVCVCVHALASNGLLRHFLRLSNHMCVCLDDSMCNWVCAVMVMDDVDQWCETHGLQDSLRGEKKV